MLRTEGTQGGCCIRGKSNGHFKMLRVTGLVFADMKYMKMKKMSEV